MEHHNESNLWWIRDLLFPLLIAWLLWVSKGESDHESRISVLEYKVFNKIADITKPSDEPKESSMEIPFPRLLLEKPRH